MAYSDAEANEALIKLAINKYDYNKTEQDTGITARTLRNWEKNFPKKGIPELLERTIERMLMVIPEKWNGQDWAIALGILIDKWQLIRGEPTSRAETIWKVLEAMPDDELDQLLTEFETAARRGLDAEGGESAPAPVRSAGIVKK